MAYVTDEMLKLIDRPGPKSTAPTPISEDMLRRFVQGVMEENPIHWDEEAAKAQGYGGVVAPPLFPLHASRRPSGTPDPFDRLEGDPDWDGTVTEVIGGLPGLDLPLNRLLNGGTEGEFFQLPRVGDTISAQSRYVSITEREGKSGPMVLATIENEYTNQDDAVLARVRFTIIRR